MILSISRKFNGYFYNKEGNSYADLGAHVGTWGHIFYAKFHLDAKQQKAERSRISAQLESIFRQKKEQSDRTFLAHFVGCSGGEEVLSVGALIYNTLIRIKEDPKQWDIQLIGLDPNVRQLIIAQHKRYMIGFQEFEMNEAALIRDRLLETGVFTIDAQPPKEFLDIAEIRRNDIVLKPNEIVASWASYYELNLFVTNLVKTVRRIFGRADVVVARNNFSWVHRTARKSSLYQPIRDSDLRALDNLLLLTKPKGTVVMEPTDDDTDPSERESLKRFTHRDLEPVDDALHGIFIYNPKGRKSWFPPILDLISKARRSVSLTMIFGLLGIIATIATILLISAGSLGTWELFSWIDISGPLVDPMTQALGEMPSLPPTAAMELPEVSPALMAVLAPTLTKNEAARFLNNRANVLVRQL